jgi:hypothetical protein
MGNPSLLIEVANQYELPILLGQAYGTAQSLWPTLDCFEDLECWNGEWSENIELWFVRRLSAIRAGAGVMNDGDWDRRDGHHDAQRSGPNLEAFTLFTNSPGGSWTGKAIGDIILPEQL